MARARNIKPGFFKNSDLADAGPIAQLLFAGLWCLADKEGRLKDKPREIKAELFPYYEADVNGELTVLERLGHIRRYVAHGIGVIEVLAFKKHQSPHHTEKPSDLPSFDDASPCQATTPVIHGELTVKSPLRDGGNPPDSLIPDSLIPDSGFTDSLIPEGSEVTPVTPVRKPRAKPDVESKTARTWESYASAYRRRYGLDPVRNATVNSQLRSLVDRLGADEAPAVAAFYVGHQSSFYVARMHSVGNLLSDAEKLRTEWATGRAVTRTQAAQADRTETNRSAFAGLISEARGA